MRYGIYESVKENITAYAVFAIGKYSEQELRTAGYEKIAEARNQREALAKIWYEIKVEWDNGVIDTLVKVKSKGLACLLLRQVQDTYSHNDRAKRVFLE